MQVPRIEKVVVNIGLGEAMAEPKVLEAAISDLTQIVGQKPVMTKSRKAIANFKLREDVVIGTKVTLRGERMYPPRPAPSESPSSAPGGKTASAFC